MWTFTSMLAAATAAAAVPEPSCPPDPRAEGEAEFLYSYASFDREAYDWAIKFLRETAPVWIENQHRRTPGDHDIWYGDTSMAYFNALNLITGYTLKLEYLSSSPDARHEREKAFCDFLGQVVIID